MSSPSPTKTFEVGKTANGLELENQVSCTRHRGEVLSIDCTLESSEGNYQNTLLGQIYHLEVEHSQQ